MILLVSEVEEFKANPENSLLVQLLKLNLTKDVAL